LKCFFIVNEWHHETTNSVTNKDKESKMSQEGLENTHVIAGDYKTARYAKHREEMLAYQKKYHEENHETFLQYQKEYYQRTKEAKKERSNMMVTCECCQKEVRRGAISGHRKTKKHLKNEATYNAAMNPEVLPTDTAYVKTLDTDLVDEEVIVFKPLRMREMI